jgi:hypothetical protein
MASFSLVHGAWHGGWCWDVVRSSADGNWVWTFVLEDHDAGTRLISRNRFKLPKLKDKLGMIPLEPGSLVMERKMLLGIKQRAERLASEQHAAA